MPLIKFISIDLENRTVTLEVDGQNVTKGIAANVTDTDAYILDLARGLALEKAGEAAAIPDTTFEGGAILINK